MASHVRPQLGLLERIGLYARIPPSIAKFFFNFFTLLPQGLLGGWPIKRVLGVAAISSPILSMRHNRYINPTTGEGIQRWAKTTDFLYTSEELDCGAATPAATLHTIVIEKGVPGKNAPVFLYFHGGAYIHPCRGSAQVPWMIEYARTAGAAQLIVLEYTLAPELKYPGQLVQAAAALQHLLDVRSFTPEQIVLAGDSAGGHLVLSLLAHIQQPHADIKPIHGVSSDAGQSLRGALLLSPWISMKADTPSYKENGRWTDMLNASKLALFLELWQPREEEVWAELCSSPAGFWTGVPVKKVIMTAGTWEAFRDQIYKMHEILQADGVDSTLSKGETEVHVGPLLNWALGLPVQGSAVGVLEWLKKL